MNNRPKIDFISRHFFFECLEPRYAFAIEITAFNINAGTVTFSGDKNGSVTDQLALGELNGLLTHNATVGNYASATDIDPGPGIASLNVITSSLIEVLAGEGDDTIDASGVVSNGVTINGNSGNDKLTGSRTMSPRGDIIDGGLDNDTINGLEGDDLLMGMDGDDALLGGLGNDQIYGGSDNDIIETGTGLDEVDGGGGDDTMVFTAVSGDFQIKPYGNNLVIIAAGDGSTTGLFGAVSIENAVIKDTGSSKSKFEVTPSLITTYTIIGGAPDPGAIPSANGDYLDLRTEGTTGRKISFATPKSGNGQWTFTSGHKPVVFQSIESFNHVARLAVGTEAGRYSQPIVKVYDAETLEHLFDIQAYESSFRGGVRVATGDIDQDGIPDIITAPGNLHDSIIKVFDGVTELRGALLTSFNAYPGNFKNGVNIAVGDVLGDNCDDIITVPSLGVADVRVFQTSLGSKLTPAKSFNGISKLGYVGGASVTVVDMNNDHKGEILIGSGYGMPSTIVMYGVTAGVTNLGQVTSSNSTLRGGTQVVTTTSTLTQPSQLIVSSGKKTSSLGRNFVGPLPVVPATRNVNSALDSIFAAFDNTNANLRAPVHLTSKDYDLDGLVDAIYLSQGTDGKSKKLRIYGPVLRTTSDSLPLSGLPWHNGANIG